jgi:hypothetical protein
MATYAGCTFDEIVTEALPRATVATDPVIRLLAGGGEHVTATAVRTTIALEVLCDTDNLTALRVELVNGTIADLELNLETVPGLQLIDIGQPLSVYQCDLWRVALTFEQASDVVTPTIGVNINGIGISGVLSVSTAVGRNLRFATATVTCTEAHGSRGDWVEIFGGSGGAVVALFKGNLETIEEDYFPHSATLTCVGTLKRLEREWNHIEEYTGQEDAAMITNFIEKRSGLHSIESSGWVLGERQDVLIQPGETFISWVDEVDEVAGYRTYDRHDGAVYRRRDDPTLVGSAVTTLIEGEKILSISLREDYDAIRNRVIVRGLPLGGFQVYSEAEGGNGDLDAMMPGTSPNYNVLTIQSDLIETVAHADAISGRALGDYNRVRRSLEVTIPFDPTLTVDDGVTIVAPSIGVGATCAIWDIQHDVDGSGGTTTITTNQGTL